jgi:ABC-type sugar transport system ATPase subunit
VSVIIISHNLEQVAEVADRVMVLRRGAKVGEAPPDAEHHDRIVSLIVGAQTGPL